MNRSLRPLLAALLIAMLAVVAGPARAEADTRPAASPPAAVFKDCADCPEMVTIPAGTFVMGSPVQEVSRFDNEGPQRTVTVSAFAAGKFAVTFAQWDACLAAGGCKHRASDEGWGRGRRPAG